MWRQLETRMVRARQIREGLQLRLQHANNKLESVQGSLTKASEGGGGGGKETVIHRIQQTNVLHGI